MNDLATEIGTGENSSFRDFEDYLQTAFMEDEPESVVDKDSFEDNFNNWLQNLDSEEWLKYGDRFKRLNRPVAEMPQFKGTLEALDKLTLN